MPMTVARCFAYGASASSSGVPNKRLCHRWRRSRASAAFCHQRWHRRRAIATMRDSIALAPWQLRRMLWGTAEASPHGAVTAARSGNQEVGQRRRAPLVVRTMTSGLGSSAANACRSSVPCDWHSARALSLLWPGGVFPVSFLAVASWGGTAVRRDTRCPQPLPRVPRGTFACAAHCRNTWMPDVQHDTSVIQPSQLPWLADRECAIRGHVHVCFVFRQRLCTSIVGVGRCANAAPRGGSLW